MDAFGALADPTRRKILQHISVSRPQSVAEIVAPLDITPSAVSQHLKILAEANFVTITKRGNCRIYSVNFEELGKMRDWISELGLGLKQSFDRLDALLESRKDTP